MIFMFLFFGDFHPLMFSGLSAHCFQISSAAAAASSLASAGEAAGHDAGAVGEERRVRVGVGWEVEHARTAAQPLREGRHLEHLQTYKACEADI